MAQPDLSFKCWQPPKAILNTLTWPNLANTFDKGTWKNFFLLCPYNEFRDFDLLQTCEELSKFLWLLGMQCDFNFRRKCLWNAYLSIFFKCSYVGFNGFLSKSRVKKVLFSNNLEWKLWSKEKIAPILLSVEIPNQSYFMHSSKGSGEI